MLCRIKNLRRTLEQSVIFRRATGSQSLDSDLLTDDDCCHTRRFAQQLRAFIGEGVRALRSHLHVYFLSIFSSNNAVNYEMSRIVAIMNNSMEFPEFGFLEL
jgi:hypothetical protein